MVGHDIRNPLQAITSELYLAKEAIANSPHIEDRTQALESINLIEEQTDYISKIVSDLQDYDRPLKPEYSEINLSELVVSVFQTISIPNKIVLKIDVKGFPKIKTDPTLIKRILTNLINNAIQAMPNGGILELTAYKKDSKAVITVSDTGKGIPEEIKPKLFTPLVTTKAKGQGLGLAVVKRLVEALHGSISFESQEGKGTKFTIELQLEA
jgi:signal transduction histidine kinase